MEPILVFISGPFSGSNAWEIEQAVRKCEDLQYELVKMGLGPLCLNVMGRFFNGTGDYEFWLNVAIKMMLKCDAVLLTDDWRRSSGATREREAALAAGIPVFDNLPDLQAWMEERNGRS